MAQYFFLMDFWWSKTIAEDKFWICTFCSKFEGIFQSRAWKKRHHQSVRANYTGSGEFFLLLAPTSSFPGCGHLATYLPHCLQWPSIPHKLCVNLAQWLNILRGDLANKLIREGCKRIMMMGTMCCGGWDKINPWSVAANSRNRRREHLNSIFTPRWV